ncbi:MAG TPA: DUF711 family protein [Anaerolineales bacterium]|nr:DUF711 family protein [Anaerolineales bacterium]
MNIRTLTYLVDPSFPVMADRIAAAGKVLSSMKSALRDAGYTVQVMRLASTPFPLIVGGDAAKVVSFAQDLEAACFVNEIDYAAIGPARPGDAPELFTVIPEAISATQNIMASAIIADPLAGVSLPAVRLAAAIIHRCATLAPDGFGNLRFGALANVPPGTPFVPAAYHDGHAPIVSVGVEAADLAVSAFDQAASLAEARTTLIHHVETEAQKISQIAKRIGGVRGLQFGGIDFSLAPYPETSRSIGTALERLSGSKVGEHGTLAAAAFIADALGRTRFKNVGFSGLFLPVFEDAVLAARAAEGVLTTNDLLLYSSVCGTGLDTVPLPGDITVEALAAILVDVGALALRLNKPLTARLMPIPGKKAGDAVAFEFPYFAPTCVLAPRASGLGGLFAGNEAFDLAPRSR